MRFYLTSIAKPLEICKYLSFHNVEENEWIKSIFLVQYNLGSLSLHTNKLYLINTVLFGQLPLQNTITSQFPEFSIAVHSRKKAFATFSIEPLSLFHHFKCVIFVYHVRKDEFSASAAMESKMAFGLFSNSAALFCVWPFFTQCP